MRSQSNTRRKRLAGWIAAITVTALTSGTGIPNQVDAGGFEPIQRIGRTFGCGWGDGYHACNDSGIRPGADLPPRSFSKQFRDGCSPGSPCASRLLRGGFYDRFDAMHRGCRCGDSGCTSPNCGETYFEPSRTYLPRSRSPQSPSCDSPHCNATNCDGIGCDAGVVMQSTGGEWVPQATIQPNAMQYHRPIRLPQVPPSPTPVQIVPSAAPTQPHSSTPVDVPAENSNASINVPSPSDTPSRLPELKLPELGSSEDEVESLGETLESSEILPPPKSAPATEMIPAPTPDLPSNVPQSNPPMPQSIGPLDARAVPRSELPDGWTKKTVVSNPFVDTGLTQPMTLPSELAPSQQQSIQTPTVNSSSDDDDLLWDDDDDDLLLFESAMLPPRILFITQPE